MKRSKRKGPLIDVLNFNKTKKSKRSTEITFRDIGKNLKVHTGNTFSQIFVLPDMLGHRIGEFAFTRKRKVFKKKKT